MICPTCNEVALKRLGQDYHLTTCGLNNVFLKNAITYKCRCGSSICLPMVSNKLNLAIMGQLLTKPIPLDTDEFVFIWKVLAGFAQVDKNFAETISFHNRDLLKFNDFSKLDTSSEEGMRRTLPLLNTANDALIDQLCMEEITESIANLLGLESRKALFKIGRTGGPAKSISVDLDFKLRELAEKTVRAEKYESFSDFDSNGCQRIYVTMPQDG